MTPEKQGMGRKSVGMVRRLLSRAPVALVCFISACAMRPDQAPLSPKDLNGRLAPEVSRAEAQGLRLGIVVATQDGRVLYAHHADGRFIPASNTKLFTTAAAFADLGALTTIAAAHPTTLSLLPRGRAAPDLLLEGGGDPTLSNGAACGTDCLQSLAASVPQRHFHRIIADDRLYPDERWGNGWNWNNLSWESGTAVSALSLNDNVASLQVTPAEHVGLPARTHWLSGGTGLQVLNQIQTCPDGPASVSARRYPGSALMVLSGTLPLNSVPQTIALGIDDPARAAATQLREILHARGVTIEGINVRHRISGDDAHPPSEARRVLATLPAGDLRDDIRYLLKVSQNLHAELLLHRMGLVSGDGSAAAGIAERAKMLDGLGVPSSGVSLYDGSGMSPYNRITPRAVNALLLAAQRQPWGAEWREDLPLAGVDGTLRHRFKGTIVAGHLHAKTGTLEATHALSGYLVSAHGQTLLISVLMNDVPDALQAPTKIMDDLVTDIASVE